jgi:WD40 repeat protein
VRVWHIVRGSNNQRRVVHVCTLAGHSAAVSCLDMSTEFSMVVSGGADSIVCVWDFRSKRMIRLLGDHKGPLLSVSINSVSGYIATLTQQQMRLYTINGELISYINPANPLYRAHGSETLSPPCVVLATPCDAWQDGVVLVTGHREGYIYLWKLGKPVLDSEEEGAVVSTQPSAPLTKQALLDRKVHAYVSTTNRSKFRELYISSVPVKIHKANITVLKLCSSAPNKAKDVSKSAEDSKALELLVGDADGMVSRWTPLKLDQLNASDLTQVLNSAFTESAGSRR